VREQARYCRMGNFFLSPAWPGCAGWLAGWLAWYTAQGGQWSSLNDTKARELRLGLKLLASHNLLLLRIKSYETRKKQLWSALSFSLFLCLSLSFHLFYTLSLSWAFSHSASAAVLLSLYKFSQHDITIQALIVLMMWAVEDVAPPRLTQKLLPDRYDLKNSKAEPLMPTQCSRRESKIMWSTVSKAAERSNSTRMRESQESVAKNMSLKIFRSAVSVLWSAL